MRIRSLFAYLLVGMFAGGCSLTPAQDQQIVQDILDIVKDIQKQRASDAPPVDAAAVAVRPTVAFINATTATPDAEIKALVAPLQTATTRDFAPEWGRDAAIVFVPRGKKPPAGSWWMVFADTSDQAGALGYHDETAEGLPIGYVFVKTAADAGYSWAVTAGHELFEMLADPDINLLVMGSGPLKGLLVTVEVGDPVEDDSLAYTVGGVKISDFATRRWFGRTGSGKMDQNGKATAAFTLTGGGYISYFDPASGQWGQVNARGERKPPDAASRKAGPHSRHARRIKPRNERMRSTAHSS